MAKRGYLGWLFGVGALGVSSLAVGSGCSANVGTEEEIAEEELGESQEAICYDECCFASCGDDPPETSCGDGYCNNGENAASCPYDCKGTCGDGVCNRQYKTSTQRDSFQNCPHDCWESNASTGFVCGNGYRDHERETCTNCPQDVGCVPSKPITGPSGGSYITATSCSSRCQYCTVWWGGSVPTYSTPGRCVTNTYGGLSCADYARDSCYYRWQCC